MRRTRIAVAISILVFGWGTSCVMAVCGDYVKDADEDCDLGRTCIGGPAAGTPCHVGYRTCTGGTCTTFGGKGCAANCTDEHDIIYTLKPGETSNCGESDSVCLDAGTSGVSIDSDFLVVPLPFGGACNGGDKPNQSCVADADCPGSFCAAAEQVLTVGKKRNGKIPFVIRASSVRLGSIPVSGLACGCVRGVASKTCGGTFFEPDGKTPSPNCTPGFSDANACEGKAPCAFVHGEGNTGAGEIGCENGLDGINLTIEQDSGGSAGPCAPPHICPPSIVLSGHGGTGSARVFQTLGIEAVLGACTGSDPNTYGPDGIFCTDDDPAGGIIAVAGTLAAVTGTVTAAVHNFNGSDGADLGPVSAQGAPFNCDQIECASYSSVAGGGVVGAFTFVHLDTVGDVAVTAQLFADGPTPVAQCATPTPGTGCAGDCDNGGDVTVNEIIVLVNIALGTASNAACPFGIVPSGSDVDITMIIKAVGNALTQCS